MTAKSKTDIKAFFETGDKPTEAQFIDLIDSYVDKSGPLGTLEAAASAGGTGAAVFAAGTPSIASYATLRTSQGIEIYTSAQSDDVARAAIFDTFPVATSGALEKTGATTFNVFTVSDFSKTLLDDADAATARTTLGVSNPVFSLSFVSSNQTITPGGTLTLAHGMGVKPKIIQLVLVCITNNAGYVAGDEVFIPSAGNNDGGSSAIQGACSAWVDDTTNIKIQYGSASNMFVINSRSGGGSLVQLTDGSWRLQVRAYA